jgi:hypothetical protein
MQVGKEYTFYEYRITEITIVTKSITVGDWYAEEPTKSNVIRDLAPRHAWTYSDTQSEYEVELIRTEEE